MLIFVAKDLAIVRMVQQITVNELLPGTYPLFPKMLGLPEGDPQAIENAEQKVHTVLNFFENLLDDRPYFGSENLTLADVVAGTLER